MTVPCPTPGSTGAHRASRCVRVWRTHMRTARSAAWGRALPHEWQNPSLWVPVPHLAVPPLPTHTQVRSQIQCGWDFRTECGARRQVRGRGVSLRGWPMGAPPRLGGLARLHAQWCAGSAGGWHGLVAVLVPASMHWVVVRCGRASARGRTTSVRAPRTGAAEPRIHALGSSAYAHCALPPS